MNLSVATKMARGITSREMVRWVIKLISLRLQQPREDAARMSQWVAAEREAFEAPSVALDCNHC